MKHLNLITISLLSIISSNLIAEEVSKIEPQRQEKRESGKDLYSPQRNFVRRMRKIHEDFERDMEEMFKMHDRMYKDFFAEDAKYSAKDFKDIREIEVTKESDREGNDWIVLIVHFSDAQIKDNNVKIKAKGNNLEGYVDFNDHKLKFFVIRGREFGTSLEYKHESEEDKKEGQKEQKYKMVVSALSTQMSLIPPVSNLERTKVNIEDGKLVIKLPSANSKQDWTTINVEKSTNQINSIAPSDIK